jgi:hypothetical protein
MPELNPDRRAVLAQVSTDDGAAWLTALARDAWPGRTESPERMVTRLAANLGAVATLVAQGTRLDQGGRELHRGELRRLLADSILTLARYAEDLGLILEDGLNEAVVEQVAARQQLVMGTSPHLHRFVQEDAAVVCRGSGAGCAESIDGAIDRWHEGIVRGIPLHLYLGMTWSAYCRWMEGQ